ncbi:MAG: DUF2905 domain-containing protein [Gloeomargarita sp. GMQP_bins_120]
MAMMEIGKVLMLMGAVMFGVGLLLFFSGRFSWLGRLPGDVTISNGDFTLIAPFGTMLLLSLLFTIVLNVLVRLGR